MRRGDAGLVSVEMLALAPWLFVLAMVAFQVGVVGWGVTSVDEAVRQGVRAQSLGQDGCAAARATLTASLTVSGCTAAGGALGDGNAVRLVVEVPVVRPAADWVPRVTVVREAFLP
ncbi:MAG: hypothetical protein ACFCVF_08235 [Kineosporiaceae bacterium]